MKAWYKKHEGETEVLRNCGNSGVDMVMVVADKCPAGYAEFSTVVNPPKRGRPRKDDSSD